MKDDLRAALNALAAECGGCCVTDHIAGMKTWFEWVDGKLKAVRRERIDVVSELRGLGSPDVEEEASGFDSGSG